MESIAAHSGSYVVAILTTGNVYPRSVSIADADLIRGPLEVAPGRAPDAIRVALAEGAMVAGVTRLNGKPVRAWVYAVPDQPDGRLLQPVASDADGGFRVQGLAPAGYLFFASDKQVPLDPHDEAQISKWRRLGQSLSLEAGITGFGGSHLVSA